MPWSKLQRSLSLFKDLMIKKIITCCHEERNNTIFRYLRLALKGTEKIINFVPVKGAARGVMVYELV